MSTELSRVKERCAELESKYESSLDISAGCLKRTFSCPNGYNFLVDNIGTTAPLTKVRARDVGNLDFLKAILKTKDGQLELCEVLQHHVLHKTLKNYVGDHVVEKYKNDDIRKQPIFCTDCSRLSYIIRDAVGKKNCWKRDKKGVILAERVLEPILKFLRKHLENNVDDYLHMSMKKYDKMEFIERNHRLLEVIKFIDDGSLVQDILKYLAPYFQLDKEMIKRFSETKNLKFDNKDDKGKKDK
jgi:hypothetical protein